MRYLGESVEKASKHCIEELRHDGGLGGVIAVDNLGHGEPMELFDIITH